MKRRLLPGVMVLVVLLTSCSQPAATPTPTAVPPTPTPTPTTTAVTPAPATVPPTVDITHRAEFSAAHRLFSPELISAQEAGDWLAGQLRKAKEDLEEAERAIQQYREETNLFAPS